AGAEQKLAETKEPKKESAPFAFSIDEIELASATLHFADEQPQHPYKTRLDNILLKVTGLTSEPGKKAGTELSFESEAKEKFSHTGTLQLAPLLAEGKLDIEGLKPGALRPYYETAVAAEIKEGLVDLSTQFIFATKDGQTNLNLSALGVNLRSFRLELAGQPEPLWRVASLAIKDSTIDLAKKTIVIGELEGKDGNGYIQRKADGVNLARIAKTQTPAGATTPPAKTDGSEWRVDAKQIAFDRFRINFDDQTYAAPAKLSLSDLSIRGANFSTAKNQRGKATIRARVNQKGVLRLNGSATANPVNAKFTVEAQDMELLPFQPFLGDQVNLQLTGGRVGTKGELTFDAGGSGPAKLNYQGGVQVADFGALEKDGQQDLLKWKSLALDAMQFDLEPFQLRIGEIALADFYS
ncbi:MAG: DUF748 domain-containing protein, partial [Candidatus Binatia bacterium]